MERGARTLQLLASIDTSANDIETATEATKTASEAIQTSSAAIKVAAESIESNVSAMPHGGFKRLKFELTIPGASGAYSANDCIANASPSITTQKIPLAGRAVGGTGSVVRAVLKTDNLSWTGQVKMVIYDGAGPAAFIADHAAFDDKYADAANIVGVIDFTAFAKTATGAAGSLVKSVVEGLNMPYECGAAVTDLYYQLFTPASSGVTPAASQKFYANIGVIRD